MQPLRGWVQINTDHPLALGLQFCLVTNVGSGIPTLIKPVVTAVVGGAPVWSSNQQGPAYQFPTTSDYLQVANALSSTALLTAGTVCVIRRKLDTTARNASLFGYDGGSADTLLSGLVPYGDGTVYWDFGNFATNRLTVAGLTFTTSIERWVFTGGPQGSTIWRNGLKLASQGTAVTRSPVGTAFEINKGSVGSDVQEISLFQMIDQQWSDQLCRWWSAEPYAALYSEVQRSYQFLASGGPTAIEGVGTATGTATVLGVGGYTTGRA